MPMVLNSLSPQSLSPQSSVLSPQSSVLSPQSLSPSVPQPRYSPKKPHFVSEAASHPRTLEKRALKPVSVCVFASFAAGMGF
ncbi:hypothetical protein BHYA_0106g00130 [Botrytis hyacinthi]|uniref:Uncharacterized protein n=1 Tax=Botrytis hyacinthi TaxID=278943 RepID=A0A4Z1GP81_9HELO|nr:hypothetical protein BHYA_0106g00130 [Botrytis hyacinthi]